MRAGDSCWSSALVTASIVPGAMSWPSAIRSDSSPTTALAASTASSPPSSVTMFPRRYRSQSRCASSARRTASLEPASSAATALSSSSCARISGSSGECAPSWTRFEDAARWSSEAVQVGGDLPEGPLAQRLLDLRGDALAVGAAADLRHQRAHDLAHVGRRGGARLRDRFGDERIELVVAQLGGKVAGDQLGLSLLLDGQLLAAALAELLGRIEAALALAAQHRELVGVTLLGRLLELGEDEAQRADPILLPRLHGRRDVGPDLLCQRCVGDEERIAGAIRQLVFPRVTRVPAGDPLNGGARMTSGIIIAIIVAVVVVIAPVAAWPAMRRRRDERELERRRDRAIEHHRGAAEER